MADQPTYQRPPDLALTLKDEFQALREADADRLRRYSDHEDEYKAARQRDIGAEVTDYGKKVDAEGVRLHNIPLPYVHPITVKHTYRVAARLPDLQACRRDSTPPERFRADTIEKMLYAAYGYSGAQLQFASGGHDGSLHGAGVFDVQWDVKYQLPCFRSTSPGGWHVVPGFKDPHDFQRAYRCWSVPIQTFRATYKDKVFADGKTVQDVNPPSGENVVTMVRCSDERRHYLFVDDVLIEDEAHEYGFVPVVIIPNLGPIREIWGYSDYEFYRHVAAYYQIAISRQADVLRAVANGTYTAENTGVDSGVIRKALRLGGVVNIRPGGKVAPVEVAKMPDFTGDHLSAVRTALDELGFTPPAAWGTLGAASGSDRALQLAPQIELTALKQIHWEAGLRRLNTMLLKLIESKTISSSPRYRGTGRSGGAFAITLDAAARELSERLEGSDEFSADGQPYEIPDTPKKVIAGDYETQVTFQQRLDRDDPQFQLAELNKFQQGAQSLRTTLEHLGFQAPEDEIRLIEQEAERYPWINQGVVNLILAQLKAQGSAGAPAQTGPGGDLSGGLQSILGDGGGMSGALSFDGLSRGLNGSSNSGGQAGGGGVPGATYGGA